MSYARFSNGDIYMYPENGHIICMGCELDPSGCPEFDHIKDAIDHLEKHRDAGHKAPYEEAIKRLKYDAETGCVNVPW